MVSNPIRRRYSLWLALIIAVVVSACLACASQPSSAESQGSRDSSASNDIVRVSVLVIVYNDKNEPLNKVKITILGGSKPFEKTTDQTGQVLIQHINWDTKKAYSAKAEFDGYFSEEKPLFLEDAKAGKNIIFTLKKLATTAQPSATVAPIVNSNANSGNNRNETAVTGSLGNNENKNEKGPTTSLQSGPWILDFFIWVAIVFVILGIPVLFWITGYRMAFYNIRNSYGLLPADFGIRLQNVENIVRDLHSQQFKVDTKMDNILSGIGQLPSKVDVARAQGISASASQRPDRQLPDSGYQPINPTPPRRSFQEEAHSLYSCLVASGTSSPEPIYLNTDAKSTPEDLLVERVPLLEEVNNSQAAFVLFANDQGQGLIYPNPALSFRKTLFRSVFPGLTEEAFHYKENITPVPVSRQQDGQWRVED